MEDYSFLIDIYRDLYSWLAATTPGEMPYIRVYKYYDKKVWQKVKSKLVELDNKKNINNIEKEFIKCRYVGTAYRVLCYNSKRKLGEIYPISYYQSCSKTKKGIKEVPLCGNRILVKLSIKKKYYAIDIFKLLEFMVKYNLIPKDRDMFQFYNIYNLERYEKEEEVVVPLLKEYINNVLLIDKNGETIKQIEKEKWFREKLR